MIHLKCIESYCDLVVVRTNQKDSLIEIQDRIKIPIINAGDGMVNTQPKHF